MRVSRGSLAAAGGLGVVAAIAVTTSFAFGGTENDTNDVRAALDGNTPKNVILFIGDGMGTQEITALRYYMGAKNPLNVDRMAFTGFNTTWSVKAGAGPDYTTDYAPDSASTGTMWATGKKTIDERISQGPSTAENVPGTNLKTAMEWAQEQGKKVGNVSTAEVTDATPAVQASHMSLRGCQGPANMATCPTETKAAGGLGSISEQMVDHKLDVLLGGGRNRFTAPITGGPTDGKTPLQIAQERGDQYASNATELAAITDKTKPVIGLFTTGNMTTEWTGPVAAAGTSGATPPATCDEAFRPAGEPSLSAMTSKAIDLLDNSNGFLLQVEGASIDKQDHAANACGQIGETWAFDQAIGVALDWQRTHPDTLIVVTADHAHTSQIVADDATGTGIPTGYTTNLTTKEGGKLALTYGTAGGSPAAAAPPSQQHTGAVVPVWAIGPQASNVLGTNDHTDLFDLIRFAKVPQSAPSGSGSTVVVPGPTQTVTTPGQTVTTPGQTVTVTAPSAPSGAPAATRFAANAAVPGAVSRSAFRRSGLRVEVVSTDDVEVTVRVTGGGKTLASGTGSGSGATSVDARPNAAGKKTSADRLSVRITLEGGGDKRTITRGVTVG